VSLADYRRLAKNMGHRAKRWHLEFHADSAELRAVSIACDFAADILAPSNELVEIVALEMQRRDGPVGFEGPVTETYRLRARAVLSVLATRFGHA
jgi:hypothetical protein